MLSLVKLGASCILQVKHSCEKAQRKETKLGTGTSRASKIHRDDCSKYFVSRPKFLCACLHSRCTPVGQTNARAIRVYYVKYSCPLWRCTCWTNEVFAFLNNYSTEFTAWTFWMHDECLRLNRIENNTTVLVLLIFSRERGSRPKWKPSVRYCQSTRGIPVVVEDAKTRTARKFSLVPYQLSNPNVRKRKKEQT